VERVPEPELMLDREQARAYARADFAEPHGRFVTLLGEKLSLPADGCALDLGCGPGDVTMRFAHAFPGWSVDGVDASPAMLELARKATAEAGLGERIHFEQLFLPAASPALARRYGLVFSNSLLHHLHEPSTLWSSIARWAQPGAGVFVMDLVRPASEAEALRLVQRYSGDEPEVLRVDFFNSLRAAYRPAEVRMQLARAGLGTLRLEVVSDRHFIVWGMTDRD
jgi:SAM-dependent methyltransferase